MEKNVSQDLRKWIKKHLKKEFESIIQNAFETHQEPSDIAQNIIHSNEMSFLLNSIKIAIAEQYTRPKSEISDSRPQSSFSFITDLTTNEWNSAKSHNDQYNCIINKISCDKPVHVRLAGYEILLKSELSNANNNSLWDILQRTLRDGLMDESRAVFEASLQVHAKLLNCSQSYDIYANLLNAFNAQYHTPKLYETLPTLISGINFKIFLHEKLFRIMHLIISHQQEVLKRIRNVDKMVEELIEQFIIFLSNHRFGNTMQVKPLSTLNIISVLEPHAGWSNRWVHNLATRKSFVTALSKSLNLLQHITQCVNDGLNELPIVMSVPICDNPTEVCISGNTVTTATYLHCLSFLSQLCSYDMGRTLLSESVSEVIFSIPNFMTELLCTLNKLSLSEAPSGVYNVFCNTLRSILKKSTIIYDSKFYHTAVCYLTYSSESSMKVWPHTLDVILQMLDTADGSLFLISKCKEHSVSETVHLKCPIVCIMQHTLNLLKQPFSIINIDYVVKLFEVSGKLFDIYDAYEILQNIIENQFYPAIAQFYKKFDKYFLENESKTQHLNSAIKKLLLSIVSIPLGLQALASEPLVFEELIRGSIAPLRTSWTSTEIISFISSAGFFQLGYNILANLASHVLSTLLAETCKALEDLQQFYDPWDNESVEKFLHILSLFSLNFKCFSAFMSNTEGSENIEEKDFPLNLSQLLYDSINSNSCYHHLGLLSLNGSIWNLDIHIYLLHLLDFQSKLLELQQNCILIEVEDGPKTKFVIDNNSLLRHQILCKSYYINCKFDNHTINAEEYQLFSSLPPPKTNRVAVSSLESEYNSDLQDLLEINKPGLLDDGWVSQIRIAHRNSRGSIKSSVLISLLNQMQKAIPVAEWVDQFKWRSNFQCNTDFWFPEEIYGINLTLHYAEQNHIIKDTIDSKEKLKLFIKTSHMFIQNEISKYFNGFDWFLSAVFIICEGDMDKCKTFVTQAVRFPSTIFLWTVFGRVIDKNNNQECFTKLTFMQLLESIVNNELPNIKYALKSTSGMDWWMICNPIISQCFWGILPWHEIMHFFAICILYPPDYMLYYCVSLLHHSRNTLLRDLTNGKKWPEHMVLDDYHCHDYIGFMNNLEKRYRSKVLLKLTAIKFNEVNQT